jgi:hypothetical protein
MNLMELNYRMGKHITTPQPERIAMVAKYMIISGLICIWGIAFVKCSLICTLTRLLDTPRWRVFLYSLMAFVVLISMGTLLFSLIRCNPVQAAWESKIYPPTACTPFKNAFPWFYTESAIFLATDTLCCILPVFVIIRTAFPLRDKIVLCILMCFGLFGSMAIVPKIKSISTWGGRTDYTWGMVDYYLWTKLELFIGIIAVSIPALRSVFESILKKLGIISKEKTGSSARRFTIGDTVDIERPKETHQPGLNIQVSDVEAARSHTVSTQCTLINDASSEKSFGGVRSYILDDPPRNEPHEVYQLAG